MKRGLRRPGRGVGGRPLTGARIETAYMLHQILEAKSPPHGGAD